jgi:hypothetical protein
MKDLKIIEIAKRAKLTTKEGRKYSIRVAPLRKGKEHMLSVYEWEAGKMYKLHEKGGKYKILDVMKI